MEQKLTSKQKNILEYIRELTMQNGEKPTSYRLHKYLVSKGERQHEICHASN